MTRSGCEVLLHKTSDHENRLHTWNISVLVPVNIIITIVQSKLSNPIWLSIMALHCYSTEHIGQLQINLCKIQSILYDCACKFSR